jgi:hypothetical protein
VILNPFPFLFAKPIHWVLAGNFSKASRAHVHTRGKHIDGQPLIIRFFPMIGGVSRRGVSRFVADTNCGPLTIPEPD